MSGKSMEQKGNSLFYCNTYYQLMVAINIKKNILGSAPADLVLTDHAAGNREIAERLRKAEIFEKVYFISVKDYDQGKAYLFDVNSIREKFFGVQIQVEKLLKLEKKYDYFWYACPTFFSKLLYSYLCLMRRSIVNGYCFEDGLAVYCESRKWFETPKDVKEKIVGVLGRKTELVRGLRGFYVFRPELLMWKPHCPVRVIPAFDKTDTEMLRLLNEIFDYDGKPFQYPFIYFEQPFAKFENRDVELLKEIASELGKEHIAVKLHPRSEKNRFAEAGFCMDFPQRIPSELMLLNCDERKTALLSVFSSALVVPYMAFGIRIKTFTLLRLMDCENNDTMKTMYQLFRRLSEQEPELFQIPCSREELIQNMKKILEVEEDEYQV